MSPSHLKFLGDLSIAPRGLSGPLLASLECTRDLGESVRVGVCVRGLRVTLRPHVCTECVSVCVGGGAGDRYQGAGPKTCFQICSQVLACAVRRSVRRFDPKGEGRLQLCSHRRVQGVTPQVERAGRQENESVSLRVGG